MLQSLKRKPICITLFPSQTLIITSCVTTLSHLVFWRRAFTVLCEIVLMGSIFDPNNWNDLRITKIVHNSKTLTVLLSQFLTRLLQSDLRDWRDLKRRRESVVQSVQSVWAENKRKRFRKCNDVHFYIPMFLLLLSSFIFPHIICILHIFEYLSRICPMICIYISNALHCTLLRLDSKWILCEFWILWLLCASFTVMHFIKHTEHV